MSKKNSKKSYNKKIRKGCKDNFHAFLVEGAEFDGYYDIPFIPKQNSVKVEKMLAYDKTLNHKYEEGAVVHFYIDDHKFDGRCGIWSGLTTLETFKKGFGLARFKDASAIVSPDFSLYLDMPTSMQIWNVFRSRAIGYRLSKLGYNVIPNVRWTDEESYDFAFDGLYKGQIVSVGTLGCSKRIEDKALLVNGFVEMINRIKPRMVIIYGPICKELKYVIEKHNVKVQQFDSDTSVYFRGESNGNVK